MEVNVHAITKTVFWKYPLPPSQLLPASHLTDHTNGDHLLMHIYNPVDYRNIHLYISDALAVGFTAKLAVQKIFNRLLCPVQAMLQQLIGTMDKTTKIKSAHLHDRQNLKYIMI